MSTTHATDLKMIRQLDKQWGDAASRHDLDEVVAFYASDGSLVWPDMEPVHGTAGIRRAWKQMIATTPGLGLQFVVEKITVAKAGDMATDFGKVILTMDGAEKNGKPGKKVREVAKYVVTWQKVRGTWKVLYDTWNTNTKSS